MAAATPPRRSSRVKIEMPRQAVAGPSTPSPARPTRMSRNGASTSVASSSGAKASTKVTPGAHHTPQAGPSRQQQETPQSQPGRRVLPARIRRAAGGGQEGIRDLEEMIVDWLERYGLPSDSPPPFLPLHLTTLPLSLVQPPTHSTTSNTAPQPLITLTPTHNQRIPTPSPRRANLVLDTDTSEKIETPGWVVVKPGEDDAEEAREEMGGGAVRLSPLKRLRRLPHDDHGEDTSDAYYVGLHRRYEAFERRQKSREKEKLVFERYRMRSRIELLRNMSEASWANVASTVLSREGHPTWQKGREKVAQMGVQWLKARLVREGKELVERYDQLLPVEPRKNRMDRAFSNASITPDRVFSSSPAMSTSPPPVLPARVSALRDPASLKRPKHGPAKAERATTPHKSPRKRAPKQDVEAGDMESDDPAILLPRKRKRVSRRSIERAAGVTDKGAPAKPTKSSQVDPPDTALRSTRSRRMSSTPSGGQPSSARAPGHSDTSGNQAVLKVEDVEIIVISSDSESSDGDPPVTSESPREAVIPPLTPSGLPCLIEAANRREAALEESLAAKARVEARSEGLKDGKKVSRFLAREKTRTSGRMGVVLPFGMPFPAELEQKYDFTITGEEDFWGIIAQREEEKTLQRRSSLMTARYASVVDMQGGDGEGQVQVQAALRGVAVASGPGAAKMSKEDVADMRAVEAAVVL